MDPHKDFSTVSKKEKTLYKDAVGNVLVEAKNLKTRRKVLFGRNADGKVVNEQGFAYLLKEYQKKKGIELQPISKTAKRIAKMGTLDLF